MKKSLSWTHQTSRRVLDVLDAKKNGVEVSVVAELKTEYKVRKTKNVSIKQMTGTASWRLESFGDIDKYIAELSKTLIAQMDGDTYDCERGVLRRIFGKETA